jgi:hypothetical protein
MNNISYDRSQLHDWDDEAGIDRNKTHVGIRVSVVCKDSCTMFCACPEGLMCFVCRWSDMTTIVKDGDRKKYIPAS